MRFFVSPVLVIYPDHYIPLHLITLMLFGKGHKLRSYISPNYRPRTEPRRCRMKHDAGVASSSCCLSRLSVTLRSPSGWRWYEGNSISKLQIQVATYVLN
jgi:hypothetical protein